MKKYLLFVLLSASFSSAFCQTGWEILEKYIEVNGGSAKWSTLNSFYSEYRLKQSMDYLNVPDSVENIISEVPYSHWKLTCLRPSFQYGTSDSGFKFIENEKGAYVDIPYHGREPMKESDLRFPIVYQVLEMMEMGSFSYLGTKNINDTLYHAVNGVMSSGKKEDTLLFDMTSYQLTFQINGANESMLARFSNYRSMEGFTIPLKTEVFYDGILFQQTMTDSVAFNIDVDKALFK